MPAKVYAYYPGCTLETTAVEYGASVRAVSQALGIELRELQGWTCCGASSAHATSHLLGVALPAHNLALAEETGLPLAVPCALCYSRLRFAVHDLKDEKLRARVNRVLEMDFQSTVTVEPILKVLTDESLPLQVIKPLQKLKVACYYGCLLVRPGEVTGFDDQENPRSMDRLMGRLSAQPVDWGMRTECCGAGMPLARPDMVHHLVGRLVAHARKSGAECFAVVCPECHANLDMHQAHALGEGEPGLPVFYFTQLLGLALGLPPGDLLLRKHLIDPRPLLREKGLAL